MVQDNKIPSLRIAVTGKCNLRCPYCPKHGDSYLLKTNNRLNLSQLNKIIEIANKIGIKHFSITGGEPLIVPKSTFSIAKIISNFSNLKYLRLNTNGTLIHKHIKEIIDSKFNKIKISLDSLKSEYFPHISDAIKLLKEKNISIRINMVVSNHNKHEISDMIKWCEKNKLELKLFDITTYKDCISKDPDYWKKNFFSLIPLSEELAGEYGEPKIVMAVGGYGNPMPVFKADSYSPIKLRISENEAFYTERCKECNDYPCQDGLCNITLSSNGILKPCRPEGLNFSLSLFDQNQTLLPDEKIKGKFCEILNLFKNSRTSNS